MFDVIYYSHLILLITLWHSAEINSCGYLVRFTASGKTFENIILNFILYDMLKKQIPEKNVYWLTTGVVFDTIILLTLSTYIILKLWQTVALNS